MLDMCTVLQCCTQRIIAHINIQFIFFTAADTSGRVKRSDYNRRSRSRDRERQWPEASRGSSSPSFSLSW